MGWVEDLGSGIRNMYKYCPIYVHGALPIMEENDVFKLTVRYEREGIALKKISILNNIRHGDKILELIAENPKVTAKEIGNALSLTERHVRTLLARLVNTNMIERKGSDKGGEWLVLK